MELVKRVNLEAVRRADADDFLFEVSADGLRIVSRRSGV